jgi:hypothetical protein
MFLHVLHPHHITPTLFLVPLNERESRGTVTNRRYCTVQLVTVVLLLNREPRLLPATRIPTTTVYWKNSVQKLQLFWYTAPQNLNFRNRHLATSSTYNSTGITSHVLTTLQHVASVLTTLQHVAYNTIVICHHVATTVAGPNLQMEAALVFRLHYHCQWYEGFYVRSHNTLISRKETCKIQSNLD